MHVREPSHGRDNSHGRDPSHGRDLSHRSDGGGKSPTFTPSGARRHRFKDDGEVPVVHVATHRDRSQGGLLGASGAGQSALPGRSQPDPHVAEDRAARERAERALESAREAVLHLQTRVGHADLALREALAQVESRDQTIAGLRQQMAEHQSEMTAARRATAQAEEARRNADANAESRIERHRQDLAAVRAELASLKEERVQNSYVVPPRAVVAPARIKPSLASARSQAAAPVEDEDEPVQWWLSSEAKAKPAVKRRKQ